MFFTKEISSTVKDDRKVLGKEYILSDYNLNVYEGHVGAINMFRVWLLFHSIQLLTYSIIEDM